MNTTSLQADQFPRKDTAARILPILILWVIARCIHFVLDTIVLFNWAYVLVAAAPPPDSILHGANRLATYLYRIMRYLTYVEAKRPFPFSEFPASMESVAFALQKDQADGD